MNLLPRSANPTLAALTLLAVALAGCASTEQTTTGASSSTTTTVATTEAQGGGLGTSDCKATTSGAFGGWVRGATIECTKGTGHLEQVLDGCVQKKNTDDTIINSSVGYASEGTTKIRVKANGTQIFEKTLNDTEGLATEHLPFFASYTLVVDALDLNTQNVPRSVGIQCPGQ